MNIEDTLPDSPYIVHFEQLARSSDTLAQRRARMILALLARLHDDPSSITLFGAILGDEFWLNGPNELGFQIWVDAPDNARLVNGFPPYYYRIEAEGEALRTSDVDEAIQNIIELASK